MVTLENGGIIKSIHGGLYRNSIWYSMYGSKGSMESAREAASPENVKRIYVNADPYSGAYEKEEIESYLPARPQDNLSKAAGHGGSDFYSMYNFIERLLGNKDADIIDVY